MRLKILILGLVCLLFPLLSWTQTYEITEVDIFSLGKISSAEEVTVYGISIKNSLKEALEKFNKKEGDIEKKEEYYFLNGLPEGLVIRSVDKKNIQAIFLHPDFKINLKGKTSKYYDLKTDEEFQSYVTECFGKPDYISQDSFGFVTTLYYLKGFEFTRFGTSNIYFTFGLMSKEDVILEAKDRGAKTLEEIKVEETKKIPLSKTGFRQTLWGMSKEQVRKAESSKFIKEDKLSGAMKGLDVLIYQDNIAGLDCAIVYYFAENRLTRARYLFTEEHSNNNLYISDFKMVKSQLSQKYGQPYRDDIIWSNDLYKDDPSEYGTAIAVGHLQYVVEWDSPEIYIQLLLKGDNFKINHWAEYTGKAFRKFEKKVIEKAQKIIW